MKTFHCDHCGFVVFFENVVCGNCGSALGFVPEEMDLVSFSIGEDGQWQRLGKDADGGTADAGSAGEESGSATWRPCHNYAVEQVCNWMVRGDAEQLCCCCRHTEIIPALNSLDNKERWFKLEGAKRRLFYSLYQLGLPVPERDSEGGLSFRFLEDNGGDKPVLTGHDSGVITLNIAEADDAQREARRTQLHEPYRTLLGHFRHEIGHYYWDRLIADTPRLDAFRAMFGNEELDYAEALAAHYASGAPAGWQEQYISAYATMHPWEDWAETWAHYLHVVDALDTAAHWGLALHSDQDRGGPADVPRLEASDQPFREVLVKQWLPLSQFLNSMGRSLGHGDVYPFVIPTAVLDKLCFVDEVVAASRVGGTCGYATQDDADAAEGADVADAAQPVAASPASEIPVAVTAEADAAGPSASRGRKAGAARRRAKR
jgi:hypothetical protein